MSFDDVIDLLYTFQSSYLVYNGESEQVRKTCHDPRL